MWISVVLSKLEQFYIVNGFASNDKKHTILLNACIEETYILMKNFQAGKQNIQWVNNNVI